jgi:hypothetical protein
MIGTPLISSELSNNSHNRISKQFVFKKDTEASFKTKITNHGKKKNDKDEIGNILLKHAFTSL